MTTKHMLIIKDAHGEIIAAQVEDSPESEVVTFITPAHEDHTLHRVLEVPSEIHSLTDSSEFHKAITHHVKLGNAKITQVNTEELRANFHSRPK